MIEAKSAGGTVLFDGENVTICRESRIAVSVFGRSEHTIAIRQIGSIAWKPATRWSAGHIRFAVPGSQAAAQRVPVNRDENAILFGRNEQAAFEQLRAAVQDALSP